MTASRSPDPPETAEQLFRQDGTYIRSLVRRQLGRLASEQDIEDISQEILLKLVSRDVVSMYDPGHASRASWRTFLGRQVLLYTRGMGETLGRRRGRELAILDEEPGGTGRWAEALLGAAWDDYGELDEAEFLAAVREQIEAAPPWSGPVSLVALFDLLVARLREGEVTLPTRRAVQAEFGVSASAARTALTMLRSRLALVLRYTAPPTRVEVGGVTLTITQARASVRALKIARGNRVAPALAAVDSPLAECGTKWFIKVGRAEVREHPECKVAKGDKETHGSQTKVALIHLLERVLAPLGEVPPPPPAKPAPPEPEEPPPTGEEVFESELWHLPGMTKEKLVKLMSLAKAAYHGPA